MPVTQQDVSKCQSVLSIRVGPVKSGINIKVPAGGSQANLPGKLKVGLNGCHGHFGGLKRVSQSWFDLSLRGNAYAKHAQEP